MIFNKKGRLLSDIETLKEENNALRAANLRLKTENQDLKKKEEESEIQRKDLEERILAAEAKAKALKKEQSKSLEEAKAEAKDITKKAEEEALKKERDALLKYNAEIKRLKDFILRMQANLPDPKERTAGGRKRAALCLALSAAIEDSPAPSDMDEALKLLCKLEETAEGRRIAGENGFDLDEVLNPSKELDLAALCRELGVME